ncbi:uncharacterized protein [Leptinotarsa decemlineata]|uniref:uncharacterized protein n=1 Tax=Leptinotarsa decemlineata TaxID=7539 RepID=UPI003D30B975
MADSKRNSSEQNSTVSDYVDAVEPSLITRRRAVKTLLPRAFQFPMADSKRNSSEQNSSVSDYVDAEESSSAQKRRAIENVLSDAFLSTVNSTMESPSCVSDDLPIIEPSSPPKGRAIKTLLSAVRRNPRRAVPIRNYFEGDKPSVLPKNSYKASLEDNPVPVGSTDRARKTVPRRILAVRYSNIHGYGVFAVKNLETGIRLGPYEGVRTDVKTETGYAWELSDGTFVSI